MADVPSWSEFQALASRVTTLEVGSPDPPPPDPPPPDPDLNQPVHNDTAPRILKARKTAGMEPTDPSWVHLHAPGLTATVVCDEILSGSHYSTGPGDIQVRYVIAGQAVSGWLTTPFEATIATEQLSGLQPGIYPLEMELQGVDADLYKQWPLFVHVNLDGVPSTWNDQIPLLYHDSFKSDYSGVVHYVPYSQRRTTGLPRPTLVEPSTASLLDDAGIHALGDWYQEPLAPHTDLFRSAQMWWEEPAASPDAGRPFARMFKPKFSESVVGMAYSGSGDKQEMFPIVDGPCGQGWGSAYVGGQVDSAGRFVHVEVGGAMRVLDPDGTYTTVAGWRVQPGRHPVWYGKPNLSDIRWNQELRGTWNHEARGGDVSGFHLPTDVALDPQNESIAYVCAVDDHGIWRVDVTDPDQAVVDWFVGSASHDPGHADGVGTAARFNRPISLVFDPVSDALYVADRDNDCIRKVTRAGEVTTVVGTPGWRTQVPYGGASNWQPARDQSNYTGPNAHCLQPICVRVTSTGELVVFDAGFAGIRRITTAGVASHITDTKPMNMGSSDANRWGWLDVSRHGTCGPLDGVFWCRFTGGYAGMNEGWHWAPITGHDPAVTSPTIFHADYSWTPDGQGPKDASDPPHYPWMIAIDPRGACLMAGSGEHGIIRVRKARVDDPPRDDTFDGTAVESLWQRTGLAVRYGLDGHNYIGQLDAWQTHGMSDDQLVAAYRLDALSTTEQQMCLSHIRFHAGPASS